MNTKVTDAALIRTLIEIWKDEKRPQYVDFAGQQYRAVEAGHSVNFYIVSSESLYSSQSFTGKK